MQVSGWLFVTLIVAAVAVVATARWMSKRNILRGREPISLVDMYQKDMIATGLNYEVFEKVLNTIGQAYDIDPRKLRLADELKSLYDLDGWGLGEGTERLNDRLAEEFGIREFEVKPKSIFELIVEIEKQIKVGR